MLFIYNTLTMKFKPQAYFIDLDGTMLDLPKKEERISSTNIKTINALNSSGRPVIISTGRANSDFVLNLAKKINSPYVICQNGGIIVDQNNKILKINEIKKDTVAEIIKVLMAEKMFFIINSGDTIYGTNRKLKLIRPWVKKFKKVDYSNLPKIGDSTKIITFGKTKRGILKLKEKLAAMFINVSLHIVSKGYSIEINDFNATKGIAAKFVCEIMNIDPKKAVHIGDSGNDVTTIPYVGAFIAMKNSTRNIKKQTEYIGPS